MTTNMIFSVTNSNCLAQYYIVNRGVGSPTQNVNPTFFVTPDFFWRGALYIYNVAIIFTYQSYSSSKFQSSMTVFHRMLLTREGSVLANG